MQLVQAAAVGADSPLPVDNSQPVRRACCGAANQAAACAVRSPFVKRIELLLCFRQLLLVFGCQPAIGVRVVQHDIHCCTDGPLVAVALGLQLIDSAGVESCHDGDFHNWVLS